MANCNEPTPPVPRGSREEAFKDLLMELSHSMYQEDVGRLQYCAGLLTTDGSKPTAIDVLRKLTERGKLSPYSCANLHKWLNDIQREDLARNVQQYMNEYPQQDITVLRGSFTHESGAGLPSNRLLSKRAMPRYHSFPNMSQAIEPGEFDDNSTEKYAMGRADMHFEESQSFLSSHQQGSQAVLDSQPGAQAPVIHNYAGGTVNMISDSSNSNQSSLSPQSHMVPQSEGYLQPQTVQPPTNLELHRKKPSQKKMQFQMSTSEKRCSTVHETDAEADPGDPIASCASIPSNHFPIPKGRSHVQGKHQSSGMVHLTYY